MIRTTLGVTATTLVVAAALALACWFVFAWASGATLITFRTGSMAPAMPQGAAAITLPAAAADLAPGDVVTVQRGAAELPITHRVIEVRDPVAADPRTRALVLQGDANAAPDAQPYLVAEVRRVVLSAPHVGNGLMLLQSPIGMGVLTLLAGALATWAFWPGRDETDAVDDPGEERAAELRPDSGATVTAASTATVAAPSTANATANATASHPAS